MRAGSIGAPPVNGLLHRAQALHAPSPCWNDSFDQIRPQLAGLGSSVCRIRTAAANHLRVSIRYRVRITLT